jgi:hypothetical protein
MMSYFFNLLLILQISLRSFEFLYLLFNLLFRKFELLIVVKFRIHNIYLVMIISYIYIFYLVLKLLLINQLF